VGRRVRETPPVCLDVDDVEVSTVVYLPPEEIYEFLVDFPRYAEYSKHLTEVRSDGDGSPGTRYFITFSWWKLSYTAHSQVTEVDPPSRIDWRLTKDIDANGYWKIEPVPEEAPAGEDHACRVYLYIQFNPHSANSDTIDLPRFVSLDWVVEKVKPMIEREAKVIVRRIVADIEGRERDVELEIHTKPQSI
jgi:ribosome-associated toxin RatA of RatAB toxin-antitoxin module